MQRNPLPPETLRALQAVGVALAVQDDSLAPAVSTASPLLDALPPARVAQLDGWIAAAADLHRAPPTRGGWWRPTPPSHAERLLATAGLEHLFLFHRDGRLREAALQRVTGESPSAFLVAAVLWRLNDWAAPVREAARGCARRVFARADAATLAAVTTALLVRQDSWGRWTQERDLLFATLARPDVSAAMAEQIGRSATGRGATLLRVALRTPALDMHLHALARVAVQPAVRASALTTLIDGHATWRSGWQWRWVDKPMGVRRRVPVLNRRTVASPLSRPSLIEEGARDRAAVVRRAALSGAIKHLLDTDQARAVARSLTRDRSPSIREKAAFILARPNA